MCNENPTFFGQFVSFYAAFTTNEGRKVSKIYCMRLYLLLMAGHSKSKMVLAQGLKGNLLNHILVHGGRHLDFLNLGLSIGHNRGSIVQRGSIVHRGSSISQGGSQIRRGIIVRQLKGSSSHFSRSSLFISLSLSPARDRVTKDIDATSGLNLRLEGLDLNFNLFGHILVLNGLNSRLK